MMIQQQVENDDWHEPLSQALRMMPRFLVIGEIRTQPAAQAALTAAVNGLTVMTTFHASDVTETPPRLLALAGANAGEAHRSLLAQGLTAIVHQQLDRAVGKIHPQGLFCEGRDEARVRSWILAGEWRHLNQVVDDQRRAARRERQTGGGLEVVGA